ncbi:ABC transporter permease subunit [Candidatus Roizmanbacteria bacterium]|nr:ABC transporter permease subunit [Candidatus Roizmanbacteria bacterium]
MGKIRQYHHHFHFSYITSIRRHLLSVAIVTAISFLLLFIIIHLTFPQSLQTMKQVSFQDVIVASINTLLRLSTAYFLSLLVAIPLALFIVKTPTTEKIFLPIFDIIQSIPVLAFFPVIVLFCSTYNVFEVAAIFVLFMSMLWNLVFTMIGGLKAIPEDVKSATAMYHIHGFNKLRYITLPAIFPYLVTGSLLAWAQGWSIIIVAEVLHTYIPRGTISQDLLGLGSLLVNSFTQGNAYLFLFTLSVMIILISLLNFFVWQRLLHIAQRYKFD